MMTSMLLSCEWHNSYISSALLRILTSVECNQEIVQTFLAPPIAHVLGTTCHYYASYTCITEAAIYYIKTANLIDENTKTAVAKIIVRAISAQCMHEGGSPNSTRTLICIHMLMHTCSYIHMYICVYTYICTYTPPPLSTFQHLYVYS